jgi:hypothetical protein
MAHLAEYEFRYNHRDEHLLRILFDGLDRPRLINGLSPRKIPGHRE